MKWFLAALLIASIATPAAAQPLPNARLSLVSNTPIMAADAVSPTLYYTDGIGVNLALDISGLALGGYDVFQANGALSTAPFNAARARANYVGSISVSTVGQLRADFSVGYDRHWEIYNAYNQRLVALRVVPQERGLLWCATNEYSGGLVPYNNNPLNRGSMILGDPTSVASKYTSNGFLNTQNGLVYGFVIGVGWNGVLAGNWGLVNDDVGGPARAFTVVSMYTSAGSIGLNTATMMAGAANNSDNCSVPGPISGLYSAPGPAYSNLQLENALTIEWNG